MTMTQEQEVTFVEQCRANLVAAGYTVYEVAPERDGGVWVVRGTDRDGLPFWYGHPAGRAQSWRVACKMLQVDVPALQP